MTAVCGYLMLIYSVPIFHCWNTPDWRCWCAFSSTLYECSITSKKSWRIPNDKTCWRSIARSDRTPLLNPWSPQHLRIRRPRFVKVEAGGRNEMRCGNEFFILDPHNLRLVLSESGVIPVWCSNPTEPASPLVMKGWMERSRGLDLLRLSPSRLSYINPCITFPNNPWSYGQQKDEIHSGANVSSWSGGRIPYCEGHGPSEPNHCGIIGLHL